MQDNERTVNLKKILFVCLAGKLRSRTFSDYFNKHYGFTARHKGIAGEYELLLTKEDLDWAQIIVFFEPYLYAQALKLDPLNDSIAKKSILRFIRDRYDYNDPFLVEQAELLYEKLVSQERIPENLKF